MHVRQLFGYDRFENPTLKAYERFILPGVVLVPKLFLPLHETASQGTDQKPLGEKI